VIPDSARLVVSGSIVVMSAPRPRSVTLASIYAGLTAVVMLMSFMDLATNWGSLEVQRTLEATLESASLPEGITVATLLPFVRTMGIIGSFFALMGLVFAVFTARGDRGSRIGLTVLCGLGLVVFMASGVAGLIPATLAMLVLMLLWSKPSREWFALVNSTEPLNLAGHGVSGSHKGGSSESRDLSAFHPPAKPESSSSSAPTQSSPTQPPPTPPAASEDSPIISPSDYFAAGSAPAFPPLPESHFRAGASAVATARIPSEPRAMTGALKAALAVMGVASGIIGGLSGLVLIAMLTMRDEVLAELEATPDSKELLDATGLSVEALGTLFTVFFAIITVACLFSILSAALAFTRKKIAWWMVLVSCLGALGLSVLTIPLGIVTAIPVVYVLIVLLREDSRATFM